MTNQLHGEKIRGLFSIESVVLAAPVRNHMAKIHASEKVYMHSALEQRRAEFSTGRVLVASALKFLDVPSQPILRGAKNEPIWPNGIVGSITHNRQKCVVALAKGRVSSGIGVDIIENSETVADIGHLILSEGESCAGMANDCSTHEELVRLTFSAKESVFKAVFGQIGRFVEFDEVSLVFDAMRRTFSATSPVDRRLNGLLRKGNGRYISFDNAILTGFSLSA